ncbi:hypothetical protein SSX86_022909 [Deinandra increscens subsp. villosa]|uniref:NAA35-like N-terminal domain-containing protein n=1 Tax=Deinandra increscens subsp. villosa TaxID=3103831 RepID=A0AAP0CJR4_9ASTR
MAHFCSSSTADKCMSVAKWVKKGSARWELLCGDNFNLFAAMSALEIMDPKMDSGLVCKYYSVEEAIEEGAAPIPLSMNKTTRKRVLINAFTVRALRDTFSSARGAARIFTFLSGPPDYGPGQLDTRRYGEQYASRRSGPPDYGPEL